MKHALIAVLACLATSAPAGDFCEDLWFTRNMMMDRAGYCFGSNLGRSLFDNSDCIGKSVALDHISQAIVNTVQAKEREFGCRVNTTKTWIDLPDINFRRVLVEVPIPDEFESGCLGWIGGPTPLYAGRFGNAGVIGQIQPGDYLGYGHYPLQDAPGWNYVTVHTPNYGQLKSAGWLYTEGDQEFCAAYAG